MTCPLTALAKIISTEVDVVTQAYSEQGLQFPGLDDDLQPSIGVDPLVEHKALIVAAATQILAMIRPPIHTFTELSFGIYGTATLAFVVDTNIPDILKEAGAKGVHVKDISAKNGVDASYIARVLRFLATRHVFKEVSPDVFANNRISSLLTKAKSLEEIRADPIARFDDAAFAAFASHSGDEALRSSVFLSSFMQNPVENSAPFNVAFKTDAKLWHWHEEPENELRARRFGAVTKDGSKQARLFTKKAELVDGITAAALNQDDLIVDVGGSLGKVAHVLYQEMPQYRYVIQEMSHYRNGAKDLETLMEGGKEAWDQVAPEALASGRVQLQLHNFFEPQPVKGAGLYLLRFITHDWPDQDAKVILKHIRDAADSSSKLIVSDSVGIHTCESSSVTLASGNKVPYPLLPCLGIAGAGLVTNMDVQMLNLFNGKERTEREFIELGEATGWKVQTILKSTFSHSFLFTAM